MFRLFGVFSCCCCCCLLFFFRLVRSFRLVCSCSARSLFLSISLLLLSSSCFVRQIRCLRVSLLALLLLIFFIHRTTLVSYTSNRRTDFSASLRVFTLCVLLACSSATFPCYPLMVRLMDFGFAIHVAHTLNIIRLRCVRCGIWSFRRYIRTKHTVCLYKIFMPSLRFS